MCVRITKVSDHVHDADGHEHVRQYIFIALYIFRLVGYGISHSNNTNPKQTVT